MNYETLEELAFNEAESLICSPDALYNQLLFSKSLTFSYLHELQQKAYLNMVAEKSLEFLEGIKE